MRVIEFNICGDLCVTSDDNGLVVLWRIRKQLGDTRCWQTAATLRLEESPAAVSNADLVAAKKVIFHSRISPASSLYCCNTVDCG